MLTSKNLPMYIPASRHGCFQRREGFVEQLIQFLVVLGRIGLEFAPEFG